MPNRAIREIPRERGQNPRKAAQGARASGSRCPARGLVGRRRSDRPGEATTLHACASRAPSGPATGPTDLQHTRARAHVAKPIPAQLRRDLTLFVPMCRFTSPKMTKIVTPRLEAVAGFPPKSTPNALIRKGFLMQAEKLAWGMHVRRHPGVVLEVKGTT